ncbi:polygalacturonase [Plectosphaerella plurivora]|uniref:Polygalacturonase n=1 Tax=Plectosphaerella plurivora TaxID=936078 RepID=A0A9P8V727_9PEZI|nr:polygalacturonase [Plectosphaerella plurivora]
MSSLPQVRISPQEGDGTAHLQAAIDTPGPLHLLLEPGIHRLGGVRLRSDLTLELLKGAEIHFVSDYAAYASTSVRVVAEESDRGMLVADGANNISIIGEGRIFGNGAAGFTDGDDVEMGTWIAKALRPRVIVLDSCRNVRIDGLRIDDAPLWTMHLIACDTVSITNVAVDNDRRMPNTDGCAIDGCTNMRIENCQFRTADDGIVLKTTRRPDGSLTGPCLNIIARDCIVESNSCALKLGTESFSDFRDIVFEDISIERSNRALGIFSRDGGAVDNIRFSRITVDCHDKPRGFWGSGEPLTINTIDRRPEEFPAGKVTGILVEDVTGTTEGAVNIVAERAGDISGITLRRVSLKQQVGKFGRAATYDLRPTIADRFDRFAEEGGTGRANAFRLDAEGRVIGMIDYPSGTPGIFAKGVEGLVTEEVVIARPTPLPEGWNPECIVRV